MARRGVSLVEMIADRHKNHVSAGSELRTAQAHLNRIKGLQRRENGLTAAQSDIVAKVLGPQYLPSSDHASTQSSRSYDLEKQRISAKEKVEGMAKAAKNSNVYEKALDQIQGERTEISVEDVYGKGQVKEASREQVYGKGNETKSEVEQQTAQQSTKTEMAAQVRDTAISAKTGAPTAGMRQ